ncbi:facilitated trehalose transporter Tret1-like [Phlebotomus papatasi]|uniref:facilitated trehalose transporter Tret1-like n=1 Tax=Phlebotomus papatasi TaxID=29031 RepID=UPI0024840025|nr:facilitated trehalose transporter Tret1-like [Phlebotomus papatasi]
MNLTFTIGGKTIQYLGAICVNISSIVYGINVGWASPVILLLLSDQSPLISGAVTKADTSLFSSILYIGGMVGTLIFGWLADRIGRKWSLFLGTLLQIPAHLLIAFATGLTHLYVSRILSGLAAGASFVVTPIYVSEIAEPSIRGSLGSYFAFSVCIGILLGFVIGGYVTFFISPYVVLAFICIFVFVFPYFPDTPQYLLLSGKVKDAEKSLRFFRGIGDSSTEGIPESVKAELEKLKSTPQTSKKTVFVSLEDFRPKSTKKALLISFVLIAGRNCCGIFPLLNFTSSIFQEAGADLSPNSSAIIVGVIQLVGLYISLTLIDRVGRRILLIISSIGTGICLAILGVHFHLKSISVDLSAFGWIPLISCSGAVFIAALGIMNVPFFIVAEIVPAKIRSSVATAFLFTSLLHSFLFVQYLVTFVDSFGMQTCMWTFAGWCFLELIFVLTSVPETKGKNAEEIVRVLEGKFAQSSSSVINREDIVENTTR